MHRLPAVLIPLFVLAACGEPEPPPPAPGEVPVEAEREADAEVLHPADAFLDNLRQHCGQAYRGELVEFNEGDADLVGEEMVMHVRQCFDDEVRVPFHVGDNHSRTWIFTRTDDGLRLKHDHRQPDGSDDELTMYGGDTVEPGSATVQSFPAGEYTKERIPYAATNEWTVTIVPGERYIYHLVRHGTDREFRVDFDLTEAVEPPPAPWGYEDTPAYGEAD